MTEKFSNDDLDRLIRAEQVEETATELLSAVGVALRDGRIPDRSRIDDAALRLRDALNPNWPADPDWLPDGLHQKDV